MVGSWAEIVATWAMSSRFLTSTALPSSASLIATTAASMPRLRLGRVRPGGHVAQALAHHGLGQHGRRGGAVAGDVVGLGGDLFDQLGAEILVRVGELDLLGDRHTVVGDGRGAELLVEDDVASARAEGDLDRVGERVDTVLKQVPGVVREAQDLRHVCAYPFTRHRPGPANRSGAVAQLSMSSVRRLDNGHFSMTARTSRAESTRYSSPAYLTSVPPYLE